MKRNTLLIAFTMGLMLVGSALAATSKHSGSMNSGLRMSGTIVSSSSSQLVLSAKVKGKTEQETFVVNPETKIKGTLSSGERAMVRYKDENGQKVATWVSAHKVMASKTK